MARDRQIQVSVVYSPANRDVHESCVWLGAGANVMQALQLSGLLQRFPELDPRRMVIGIWGRRSDLRQTLRDNDRVEIYRSLRVDPKVARRERFAKQGVRGAGLFDTKRSGTKAG